MPYMVICGVCQQHFFRLNKDDAIKAVEKHLRTHNQITSQYEITNITKNEYKIANVFQKHNSFNKIMKNYDNIINDKFFYKFFICIDKDLNIAMIHLNNCQTYLVNKDRLSKNWMGPYYDFGTVEDVISSLGKKGKLCGLCNPMKHIDVNIKPTENNFISFTIHIHRYKRLKVDFCNENFLQRRLISPNK